MNESEGDIYYITCDTYECNSIKETVIYKVPSNNIPENTTQQQQQQIMIKKQNQKKILHILF